MVSWKHPLCFPCPPDGRPFPVLPGQAIMSHDVLFRSWWRPSLSGVLFFQVKAAAICPACLQKGDPPGKVAVYEGILPPEQGL